MNSIERFPLDQQQYQLIDFGGNEKLEFFGGKIVRRETPSGPGLKTSGTDWDCAELTFKSIHQNPRWDGQSGADWFMEFGPNRFNLRQTPSGQVGVFPEQAVNWSWIEELPIELSGIKALNLFAYTGGTTLALAQRGAKVVHCDAAKSVVNWARSNAAESGLQNAPIRWIVEDALTFVRREIKRGNRYQIVVADPPSFGRGPGGESWKIQRDFRTLIEELARLTGDDAQLALISCLTPEVHHTDLRSSVSSSFRLGAKSGESFELQIPASSGKSLASGQCFRWFNNS